jgi:hypothetical protein
VLEVLIALDGILPRLDQDNFSTIIILILNSVLADRSGRAV